MNKFSIENIKFLIGLVKTYVEGAIEKVNGDNTKLAGRVSANETAIEAINNESTGILAKAKAYFAEQWAALTNADGGVINKLNEIVEWFSGLQTTDPGAVALLTDVAGNKSAIGAKGEGDTPSTGLYLAVENAQSSAESHADTVVGNLADGQVKTNKEAIEAINNETTGILALAKADATTKAGDAEQNAKDYTDEQIEAISAYTELEIKAAWDEVFAPESETGE